MSDKYHPLTQKVPGFSLSGVWQNLPNPKCGYLSGEIFPKGFRTCVWQEPHTHTQPMLTAHTYTHRKFAAKVRSPNASNHTSRTRSQAAFTVTDPDRSGRVTELICCVLTVTCRSPQQSSTDCLRPAVRHRAFWHAAGECVKFVQLRPWVRHEEGR
jgi:hypothetical protein